MICDSCKKEPHIPRLREVNRKWLCRDCLCIDSSVGLGLVKNVFIEGYGKVSLSRLEEVKRRRILPYEKSDPSGKGYYLGRMGENGKIQEKQPTY